MDVGPQARLGLDVAAIVDSVSGVRRTSQGGPVEMAMQYRGGKVDGVTLGDGHLRINIVAEQLPLKPLTNEIRTRVERLVAERGESLSVDVRVVDLDPDASFPYRRTGTI